MHDHHAVDDRLRRLFDGLGVPPPAHIVRTQSLSVIRSLVLGMDAIALFSVDFVASELHRGDLKLLEFSALAFESWAGLLYRRDVVKTPAMKLFMTEIGRACAAFKGAR